MARTRGQALLREPLMHFLILGGLLFAAYAWINRGGREAPGVVRITAQEVDWLREVWVRQWQRTPSEQDLSGLVGEYLREQLLAREARALGLDENDVVVRRHLAQKLEFLVKDAARLAEPADEELLRAYEANRERYREPARVSFTQIFFRTEGAAAAAMARIATGGSTDAGDGTLLAPEYIDVDEPTVANLLGGEFAAALFEMEPGGWHGPLESVYGFHLLSISARHEARLPPFEEVRGRVLEQWHRARQAEVTDRFYADLLEKYAVVVDDSVRPLLGSLLEEAR